VVHAGRLLLVPLVLLVACEEDSDPLSGYPSRGVTMTSADSSTRELQVLVADTEELRAHGLMEVTDLDPHDGMLFVFETDTAVAFWMKNTVLPLSIAFFDADGRFVSATDMTPCPPQETSCPTYPPGGHYRYALEVEQGDLASLGITEGTVLDV